MATSVSINSVQANLRRTQNTCNTDCLYLQPLRSCCDKVHTALITWIGKHGVGCQTLCGSEVNWKNEIVESRGGTYRNAMWHIAGDANACSVYCTSMLSFAYYSQSVDSDIQYSFFRAANAIFGKVGRIASEEILIQLLKMKCLPILLYSLEVCNLSKRNLQSLDFTVNRFFMKLFNTNNMHIINVCQLNFAFELPSVILPSD